MAMKQNTIIDRLDYWVGSHPKHTVLHFTHPNGTADDISYERLHEDACRIALHLQSIGIRPGNLVLLAFEHGYPLAATFLGAIYAGAIPSMLPYITHDKIPLEYAERIGRQMKQTGA